MGGEVWSVLVIAGPILLLAVAVWAWLKNRNAPRSTIDRAERGAANLRDDIEDGVPPPRE